MGLEKERIHIIVEGCDATGKTTLIQELHRHLGYDIVKGSDFSIAEKGVDAMFEYMKEVAATPANLIIDRDFFSNLVYAPLYDKNMLTDEMVAELINMKKGHSFVIYLHGSLGTVTERIGKRGDDYVKMEHLQNIMNSYHEIIHKFEDDMRVCKFDIDIYDSYTLAEIIANAVKWSRGE